MFASFARTAVVLLPLLLVALAGCNSATSRPFAPFAVTDDLDDNSFAALPGWETDNLREAWPVFLASCKKLARKPDWKAPCIAARQVNPNDPTAIQAFFESHFQPQRVRIAETNNTGLMTGYYEPLLHGARRRSGPYQTPLHSRPSDLLHVDLTGTHPELRGQRTRGKRVGKRIVPYPSRAELTASNQLRGKELVWVDDPVDAFFLQVQGSGRVELTDTHETVRLAYADQNGQPYKSIGRHLAELGEIPLEQASAQNIKSWLAEHPDRTQELLNANPSYIFFKEEKIADPSQGPKGALGIPLTPGRSVAVDPAAIPLGVPLFIATTHPIDQRPLQRLTFAQDTGSAIKGDARLDFFWGFGSEAGEIAGKTKQRVAVWVLYPKNPD